MLGYLKISRIHMMRLKNKRTFCFKEGPKAFPYSVEDFEKLRLNYPFYTDKSLLIKKVQNSLTLITYPSRWGKTQNLMMIKEFYSPVLDDKNKILDKQGTPRYALFGGGQGEVEKVKGKAVKGKAVKGKGEVGKGEVGKGEKGEASKIPQIYSKMNLSKLNIADCKDVMDDYGKYPVIHLAFGNLTEDDPKLMLKRAINKAYMEHAYLLNSTKLLTTDKEIIFKCQNVHTMGDDITSLIENLNSYLYKEFGKEVVILIDEYDKPLNHFLYNRTDGMEKTQSILNSFYTQIFKTGSKIKSSLITGVMKYSVKLISPALNSFQVFNFPDTERVSPYYGFSEDEVKQVLKISLNLNPKVKKDEEKINEIINGMRVYYNGYTIKNISYYNPWSINNFVSVCRETGYNHLNFKRYWTSINALRVFENCFKYPKLTEMIVEVATGKSYKSQTQELDSESFHILRNITFGIQQKVDNYELKIFTNFLVCTGYLIKFTPPRDSLLDGDYVKCPNKEVRQTLLEQLFMYLEKHNVNSRELLLTQLKTLLVPDNNENILKENLKTFKNILEKFFKESLEHILVEEFTDDNNEKQIKGNETVMVSLFYAVIYGLKEKMTIDSKIPGIADQRRPDLCLITGKRNIVFEFKHKSKHNKNNDKLLEEGYKQCEGYAELFKRNVELLGIVIVTNNQKKVEGLKAYLRGKNGLIKEIPIPEKTK
jgi:hypothetical protein